MPKDEERTVKWHVAMIYLYASQMMELPEKLTDSHIYAEMQKIRDLCDRGIQAYRAEHPMAPPPPEDL